MKCPCGCGKEIPEINIEFGGGGFYFTPDGDLYASRQCHRNHMNRIGEAIQTEEGCLAYLRGEGPS